MYRRGNQSSVRRNRIHQFSTGYILSQFCTPDIHIRLLEVVTCTVLYESHQYLLPIGVRGVMHEFISNAVLLETACSRGGTFFCHNK